jgi:hypothetical protein
VRRLAAVSCALAVVLGTFISSPNLARADGATEVTITCSDGNAMTGVVTLSTLLQLTQEVQTLSGCSLSQDPSVAISSTDQTGWTVYDYNPSGQAISPRKSPSSMPATTSGNATTFAFKPQTFTALLTTTDKNLTGDLSAKSLSATVNVSGVPAGTFRYQPFGCGLGSPGFVRFYFTSARASGSSDPAPGTPVRGGLPPAGFYTQFWWSNPVHVDLVNGAQPPGAMLVQMADMTQWSDWDGKPAFDPLVMDQFLTAIENVKSVGFSFGGGCFFENGVTFDYPVGTPPPYEFFTSTFDEL